MPRSVMTTGKGRPRLLRGDEGFDALFAAAGGRDLVALAAPARRAGT